jgi:phosphoribosylglycinamide formyltransferase-1
VRIGVLASGAGTNLQAIVDRVHGQDGVEIVAVGGDKPEAPALQRAAAAGIETAAFPRAEHPDRTARDAAMADWLAGRGVELVVLAGYMQLVTADFLARFGGNVINVHPALLPAFPGLHAVEQAVDHGVKVTGVTVHYVDSGVDTGPIIAQRALALEGRPTAEDVAAALRPLEHELLCGAIAAIAAGRVRRDPEHPRRILVGA